MAFQERGRDGGRQVEAQEDVAYALTAPNGGGRRQEMNIAVAAPPQAYGGNNTAGEIDVATARNAHGGPHGRLDFETETFVIQNATRGQDQNGLGVVSEEPVAPTLDQGSQRAVAYAFEPRIRGDDGRGYDRAPHVSEEVAPTVNGVKQTAVAAFMPTRTLATDGQVDSRYAQREVCDALHASSGSGNKAPLVKAQSGESGKGDAAPLVAGPLVRRLLPAECERLQGYPDGFTAIRYRGKPAADGPRYRALGNSFALPVVAWIGRRLQMVDPVPRGTEKPRR